MPTKLKVLFHILIIACGIWVFKEHDISFLTRNKIMMVLNKYSMQHTMSEYLFWKEKIYSEVKDFPNLDNCEFKKMLLLFWKDYVITDE